MLEPILQGLREVEGVQGAMIVDQAATVIAHRAHAVYDLSVLQQVARSVVNSVDSVQLIQDDWEILTAHFGEGKLLLRSIRVGGAKPRRYILTVIADQSLNVAFLGVALRVAASKLVTEIEANPNPQPMPQGSMPMTSGVMPPPNNTGRIPTMSQPEPVRAELAKNGITWSGVSSGSNVMSGSGIGSSEVTVADPASSTFLSGCTKALAVSVGPMAKVLVKEAVRKVCGHRPFSRADGEALLETLLQGIDDKDDRAQFVRTTRVLL